MMVAFDLRDDFQPNNALWLMIVTDHNLDTNPTSFSFLLLLCVRLFPVLFVAAGFRGTRSRLRERVVGLLIYLQPSLIVNTQSGRSAPIQMQRAMTPRYLVISSPTNGTSPFSSSSSLPDTPGVLTPLDSIPGCLTASSACLGSASISQPTSVHVMMRFKTFLSC